MHRHAITAIANVGEQQVSDMLRLIEQDEEADSQLARLLDTQAFINDLIEAIQLNRIETAVAAGSLDRAPVRVADPLSAETVVIRAVFDPAEARRRMVELTGHDVVDPEFLVEDSDASSTIQNLSSEDSRRYQLLSKLNADARNGNRTALIADRARLAAIQGLINVAPHFSEVIDVVADAAATSVLMQAPIVIPPLLLLGGPGIGKTIFARKLAEAIGTQFVLCPLNLSPAFGGIGGLSSAWKGAKPGKVATSLVAGETNAPLFLFDEVDKALTPTSNDRPLDPLHSLWERENATAFVDEYYDTTFDASNVISVATANGTESLADSLLDRLLVIRISNPTREQRRAIAIQIYAKTAKTLGIQSPSALADEALDMLSALTPRRMARALEIALPMALRQGVANPTGSILRSALVLVEQWKENAGGIGFLLHSRHSSNGVG